MVMATTEMNKQFEYRGYKFNIKVELFTQVEKRPNGITWHTVIINDMGQSNYYKKDNVNDSLLMLHIASAENEAKKFVDTREDGEKPPHDKLAAIGFV